MKELFHFFRTGLNYAWDNAKVVGYIALILFPFVWLSSSKFLDHLQLYPFQLALFMILIIGFRIFLAGGVAGIVNESVPNQSIKMTHLFQYGKKFFTRLLGLSTVYMFTMLVMVLVLVPFEKQINNSTLLLSALVALILAVIYYTTPIYLLSFFALICEDRGVIDSVKRGFHLSSENHNRLKVFGLILMYLLTFFLIGMGLGLTFGLLFDFYFEDRYALSDSVISAFFGSLGMVCFSSIFIPYFRKLMNNPSS